MRATDRATEGAPPRGRPSRRRLAIVVASVVVALVLVVTAGVWWAGANSPVPAADPTPSSTPSAEPAPTASATPEPATGVSRPDTCSDLYSPDYVSFLESPGNGDLRLNSTEYGAWVARTSSADQNVASVQ